MQKNQIELAGYLAAKPSVRLLPSGTKVANARLAEGYQYNDRQSKTSREHTNWHSLVFYGVLAEIAVTYEKGDNICVEGSLQARQFTPKDGSERTVHEIIVKSCHAIEPPRNRIEAPAANDPGIGAYETGADGLAADLAGAGVKPSDWPA
jgi:single-strand DNA-binding protein